MTLVKWLNELAVSGSRRGQAKVSLDVNHPPPPHTGKGPLELNVNVKLTGYREVVPLKRALA